MADEIAAVAIAGEKIIADGDSLDDGTTALFQPFSHGGEILRPIMLTHGFEHFDRDDVVEGALGFAIILQPDVGAAAQAVGGEFVLRRRNGEAGDAVLSAGCPFRETAPTTTDLQHAGA